MSLKQWIPRLAGQQVLVIGDIILDEYLTGRATRMSREAPVPVLEFESRRLILGGAANPAVNIARLGSTAVQCGVTGSDPAATQLRQLLQSQNIETHAIVTDATRPTTVKMRVMAQMGLRFPQQVARLDTLSRAPISSGIEEQIKAKIVDNAATADAVLVSDYHGGLLTESLVAMIRSTAQDTLLTADTQGDLEKYQGFTVVKCNADDAQVYLGRELEGNDAFGTAARDLFESLQLSGAMMITRGPEGATIATHHREVYHCPTPAVTDVYDVVGAGDTSIAVLTLALAAGAPYADAATLANYASSLVVRRFGNYAPTPDELAWALDNWSSSGSV